MFIVFQTKLFMRSRKRHSRRIELMLFAALLVPAVFSAFAQQSNLRISIAKPLGSIGERVREIEAATDSSKKHQLFQDLLSTLRQRGTPVVEDSMVYFIYSGEARTVTVPGDFNGWNPRADTMKRVERTSLFYLVKQFPPAGRVEYKLCVDSIWMLDPLNRRQVAGGYGLNSEVWMPFYRPPAEIEERDDIARGRIDTIRFTSKVLGRTHSVLVYLPPGYDTSSRSGYPTLYVNDGGEYITLGRMPNVLNNLIADGRVPPVVSVFVDPRTDMHDASTSKRMQDYSLSDTYVRFLVEELRPYIIRRYRVSKRPDRTAIMGASLGGLISTYAAFKRPDVFGLSAAQSPAYWWANDTLITMVAAAPRKNVRFYIDTGTLHDAQEKAFQMKSVMERKGYAVHYEEHPEGHNWANWRARISRILEYFWGRRN